MYSFELKAEMLFGSNVRFSTEGGDAKVNNQHSAKIEIPPRSYPNAPHWPIPKSPSS
jgi:hypothetical protein